MQIQEFNRYVKDHIKEYLPPEYETAKVSVVEVTKSNDRMLSGLTILREGENFSPTVYLEPFAEQVAQGRSLEDAMREIAEIQTIHHAHTPVNISTFMDYESVRPMTERVFASGSYGEALCIIGEYVNITDSAHEHKSSVRQQIRDTKTAEPAKGHRTAKQQER